MSKGPAIFVKIEDEEYSRQPSSDEPKGYTCWRWYEAEFDDKPNAVGAHRITFWPLPAYGLRIGSVVREWPGDARVVRRVKELRQCEEWAARARRNEPRMQFHCSRAEDGTVTVQNVVSGGMMVPAFGQRHTHSAEEWETWRAARLAEGHEASDFVWSKREEEQ